MKRRKKKTVLLLLLWASLSMTACGRPVAPEAETGGPKRNWTDSLGREVLLPEKTERVAVTGPMAQIVLYALAPETLVGLSQEWSDDSRPYVPEPYLSLPVFGQLYGGKGEINLEELLAADPDVVIDIGESMERTSADLSALSGQTGIPFVHVSMTAATTGDTFRKLGDLLGCGERAEEYAAYCETVYERTVKIAEEIGEENKADFLYITGTKGLNVIAEGSYYAEFIDLLTENAAKLESPSPKGTGNEVDMEQILRWDPEVIVFSPDSIYDSVASMPEWQNVSAIKNGKYCEVPFAPYNWMGFPSSVQRYLGMLWLPAVLYPDAVTYDLKEEVTGFYRMFYHCDLSEEQYRHLTKKAFMKHQ